MTNFASHAQTDRVLDRCCKTAEQLVQVLTAPTPG